MPPLPDAADRSARDHVHPAGLRFLRKWCGIGKAREGNLIPGGFPSRTLAGAECPAVLRSASRVIVRGRKRRTDRPRSVRRVSLRFRVLRRNATAGDHEPGSEAGQMAAGGARTAARRPVLDRASSPDRVENRIGPRVNHPLALNRARSGDSGHPSAGRRPTSGVSEASAFRRWTGQPPGDYR